MTVLVSSALGFAVGAVDGLSKGRTVFFSRFGFDYTLSILGGRAFSPGHKPPRLPALPKAVLGAMLACVIALLLYRSDCPGFVEQHLMFFLAWFACGISTATWLREVSIFQRKAEAERSARIEEFLADPGAPVPPAAEKMPSNLTRWNYLNLGLFVLLILIAAVAAGGQVDT